MSYRYGSDRRAQEIVDNYALGAGVAMMAIPVPGADMTATVAVWGKMISELAALYGYEVSLDDAGRLASDLFKGVILTTAAWFASAKTASLILKFIPGAGTVAATLLDAVIAGFGAKRITGAIGLAAAAYYKSYKTLAPKDLTGHVKNFFAKPGDFRVILSAISGHDGGHDL